MCELVLSFALLTRHYSGIIMSFFSYRFWCVSVARVCRFWYISLVSCHRNSSCAWLYKSQMSYLISYDIWMVNGHPDQVSYAAVLFSIY